jgi:hypothetical protein
VKRVHFGWILFLMAASAAWGYFAALIVHVVR